MVKEAKEVKVPTTPAMMIITTEGTVKVRAKAKVIATEMIMSDTVKEREKEKDTAMGMTITIAKEKAREKEREREKAREKVRAREKVKAPRCLMYLLVPTRKHLLLPS